MNREKREITRKLGSVELNGLDGLALIRVFRGCDLWRAIDFEWFVFSDPFQVYWLNRENREIARKFCCVDLR
jgi:hypothetical protein